MAKSPKNPKTEPAILSFQRVTLNLVIEHRPGCTPNIHHYFDNDGTPLFSGPENDMAPF